MMNYYCLDADEFTAFAEVEVVRNKMGATVDLQPILDQSKSWELQIGLLNYLFARLLLGQRQLASSDGLSQIHNYLGLGDYMWIARHECDEEFVDYMFKCEISLLDLSLEDKIIETQQLMGGHISVRPLRP